MIKTMLEPPRVCLSGMRRLDHTTKAMLYKKPVRGYVSSEGGEGGTRREMKRERKCVRPKVCKHISGGY
jgi:hypothetical protein